MLAPALRMQRVTAVLLRHGFGELLQRRRPDGAGFGPRIARVLADLGPTFIKLGQLLATREDLFPPELTRALAALHANVPPMRPRVVDRQLERALGRDVAGTFAFVDPRPLAAASIGQVHRARLATGEAVVVKIQRPGLARIVQADLALMRFCISLLAGVIPELEALDLPSLLDAFERSMASELDFTREADNGRRLAELLAGAPEVRVPLIYRELSRPTLLVMEEVHGRRLRDLDQDEQRRVRARLLRAFARQVLDHGVFHGDPHPGNMLVDAAGRVVLLDLGTVEQIDARLRMGLGRLVRALALGRTRAPTDAVLALSPDGATVAIDRARVETELAELVASATGPGDGARVLSQMIAFGRTHRLRLHPSLLALVRTMALLVGVLRGLDPARDVVADLRREWLWSFGRRIYRGVGRSLARGVGRVFGGRLGAPVQRMWLAAWRSVTNRVRRWNTPPSPAPLLVSPWLHLLQPPPSAPDGSSPPPSTSSSSSSSRS